MSITDSAPAFETCPRAITASQIFYLTRPGTSRPRAWTSPGARSTRSWTSPQLRTRHLPRRVRPARPTRRRRVSHPGKLLASGTACLAPKAMSAAVSTNVRPGLLPAPSRAAALPAIADDSPRSPRSMQIPTGFKVCFSPKAPLKSPSSDGTQQSATTSEARQPDAAKARFSPRQEGCLLYLKRCTRSKSEVFFVLCSKDWRRLVDCTNYSIRF